ncbi:MAG: DNA repair protein RadC [Elainellaceae cyanobacterium]
MEQDFSRDPKAEVEPNHWTEWSLDAELPTPEPIRYCSAELHQFTLRIRDLPSSERPRDRLMTQGAHQLSTGELLSILLGSGQGSGKLSAVGLGQLILQSLGEHDEDPLVALRQCLPQELMEIEGIGPAKAAIIVAAIELGKRVFYAQTANRPIVDDPSIAAAILAGDLMWHSQERFAVLLLDVRHRVLGHQVITTGTATETLVHPRDVFREVIRKGATRVIVAHNHPSGVVEPSPQDITLTRQLLQAAQVLSIPVLDHLILGKGNHHSLRQSTTLWDEIPQEEQRS